MSFDSFSDFLSLIKFWFELFSTFTQINSTINSTFIFNFLRLDINECQLDPDSCDDGYKCINTVGSFDCILLSKKPKYEVIAFINDDAVHSCSNARERKFKQTKSLKALPLPMLIAFHAFFIKRGFSVDYVC